MKQHTREYFVYRVRSGIVEVQVGDLNLYVHTPTIEQEFKASKVFLDHYDKAFAEDIMTEEQMSDWMLDRGTWTEEDDKKIDGLKKDLERLKIEIYKARNNTSLKERIRLYIRAGEEQLRGTLERKFGNHLNTCEGVASAARETWIIKNCTFTEENRLYNFNDASAQDVIREYRRNILDEVQIREIARNEPWRSVWSIKEKIEIDLFSNKGKEVNYDQKNLIVWSSIYDSIQESVDCPNEDVIDDDDMLDGWFLLQAEKRKKEQAEMEFEEGTNEKIKNADEVFVVTNNEIDKERVEGLNNIHAHMVKQEREALLMRKHKSESGPTGQGEFRDEQLKLTARGNEVYKGKFGG